jgi:Holliday junction resolvasome RuvABC DNA-binding subunit
MRNKRQVAAEARAAARVRAQAKEDKDIIGGLTTLGYSASQARSAAELCMDLHDASLEQRMRVALSYFRVRGTRIAPCAT